METETYGHGREFKRPGRGGGTGDARESKTRKSDSLLPRTDTSETLGEDTTQKGKGRQCRPELPSTLPVGPLTLESAHTTRVPKDTRLDPPSKEGGD